METYEGNARQGHVKGEAGERRKRENINYRRMEDKGKTRERQGKDKGKTRERQGRCKAVQKRNETRKPHLPDGIERHVTESIYRSKPLIGRPEDRRLLRSPVIRILVTVRLLGQETTNLLKRLQHFLIPLLPQCQNASTEGASGKRSMVNSECVPAVCLVVKGPPITARISRERSSWEVRPLQNRANQGTM